MTQQNAHGVVYLFSKQRNYTDDRAVVCSVFMAALSLPVHRVTWELDYFSYLLDLCLLIDLIRYNRGALLTSTVLLISVGNFCELIIIFTNATENFSADSITRCCNIPGSSTWKFNRWIKTFTLSLPGLLLLFLVFINPFIQELAHYGVDTNAIPDIAIWRKVHFWWQLFRMFQLTFWQTTSPLSCISYFVTVKSTIPKFHSFCFLWCSWHRSDPIDNDLFFYHSSLGPGLIHYLIKRI